jgi:hypothetical protein
MSLAHRQGIHDRSTVENPVGVGNEWDAPLPLELPVDASAEFPVDAFPDWLAAYCRAYSESTQTPVDAISVLALGAFATALQGRVRVRLLPDWVEETCLFVLLVMESGTKKSPTFRAAFAPIVQAEIELCDELRSVHSHACGALELAEERARIAKNKAVKSADAEAEYQAALLAVEEARTLVLASAPPRFYAEDATPEAFVELLKKYQRMTIASAEGGWFQTFAGRYSEGKVNLDSLLKGWGGEGIRVDRKGAEPIDIPNAICGILVAVQRDVLREMSATRGVVDRGLLARFVKAAPATRRGFRNVVDPPPIPEALRAEYAARVSVALYELREHEPVEIRLDSEAQGVFTRFRVRHEEASRPGGRVYEIGAWAEKHAGMVARIAAILHFAGAAFTEDAIGSPITADTMASAITIGNYFVEQEIALEAVTRVRHESVGAQAVLDWIRTEGVREVSTREVQRAKAGRTALRTAEQVRAALILLADHGYVARIDSESSTSERWAVNPAVLNSSSAALTPRQSRQAGAEGDNSVDIVNVSSPGEAS